MKLAILSNILGNKYALQAALDTLGGHHIDDWIILGNSIGFGPHDNVVLKNLRNLNLKYFLNGLNEKALFDDTILNQLNLHLANTIIKSRQTIQNELKGFIEQSTDHIFHKKKFLFLPKPTSDGLHIQQIIDYLLEIINKNQDHLVITSYLYQSFAVLKKEGRFFISHKRKIDLSDPMVKLVNIGATGYTFNGSTSAQMAILDDEANFLKILEVDYDFTKTQRDMQIAGTSQLLIKKLSPGYNNSFSED